MKTKIFISVIVIIVLFGFGYRYFKNKSQNKNTNTVEVEIQEKEFVVSINATGNAEPLNKVSILPPVAGRIDKVLVEEGDFVKKGQQIAIMSSTPRAAILDIVSSQNKEELEKWNKIYLPTPIVAPVSGLIIKKNVVPGQTVNMQSELFVMSDELIVRAFVDETDIGKIKEDMLAKVRFDAYSDKVFDAFVKRISHQSVLFNNVSVYTVELNFKEKISFLRAGMSANVDFIIYKKDKALVVPVWAVDGKENTEVIVNNINKEKLSLKLGMSNGEYVEILDGARGGEKLLVSKLSLDVSNIEEKSNPFAPKRIGAKAGRNR